MKKFSVLLIALALVWFAGAAEAISYTSGTDTVNVYGTVNTITTGGITWLEDANFFGAPLSDADAINAVNGLSVAGSGFVWQLPTAADLEALYIALGSPAATDPGTGIMQIDNADSAPFLNIMADAVYWTGTSQTGFDFFQGTQVAVDTADPNAIGYAWAVRVAGDTGAQSVPEPGTLFLFGSGMFIMFSLGRMMKG